MAGRSRTDYSRKFATNPVLQSCLEHVRKSGGRLHFFGLLSHGSVHSSIEHLFALVDAAAKAAVPIAVHAFGDGRDVPPSSMQIYVAQLEAHLAKAGTPGAIASVSGRFYAMDRDKRWERVQKAYRALAEGKADHAYPTRSASAMMPRRLAAARGLVHLFEKRAQRVHFRAETAPVARFQLRERAIVVGERLACVVGGGPLDGFAAAAATGAGEAGGVLKRAASAPASVCSITTRSP